MARKPITREDLNPSYDELIQELLNANAKLLMDSLIAKLTIQKLEKVIHGLTEEINSSLDEGNKEF